MFIVDCWVDTKEKENTLIKLLSNLKVYGAPIILCGHYAVKPEIYKLADYFLYIKDNDILKESEYQNYGVYSDRWTDMGTYKVINKTSFHHDYAIWCAMRNSFNFAKSLGKKHIHFFEYDNLINTQQYRQAFLEESRKYDAILYEYSSNSVF